MPKESHNLHCWIEDPPGMTRQKFAELADVHVTSVPRCPSCGWMPKLWPSPDAQQVRLSCLCGSVFAMSGGKERAASLWWRCGGAVATR